MSAKSLVTGHSPVCSPRSPRSYCPLCKVREVSARLHELGAAVGQKRVVGEGGECRGGGEVSDLGGGGEVNSRGPPPLAASSHHCTHLYGHLARPIKLRGASTARWRDCAGNRYYAKFWAETGDGGGDKPGERATDNVVSLAVQARWGERCNPRSSGNLRGLQNKLDSFE